MFSNGWPVAVAIGGKNFPPELVNGHLTKENRDCTYVFEEFNPSKPEDRFPKVHRLPNVAPQDLQIAPRTLPNRLPEIPAQKQVAVKEKPKPNATAAPGLRPGAIFLNPYKRPYEQRLGRFN